MSPEPVPRSSLSTACRPTTDVVTLLPTHVRTAVVADLAFLDDLQNRNRHALGFLPWSALASYLAKARVLIAEENNDPAGYFLTLPSGKIVQAAVDFDARRRHLATALLTRCLAGLAHLHLPYAGCWCADDLDANAFWQESGFLHDATRELRHAGRLRRNHRHWTKMISRQGYPDLHAFIRQP